MSSNTVRLTMAQALVRYLCSQFTEIDGERVPLFAGVFAIFGHGNVTCLSEALETVRDRLPTWRGQNEQSMALAAIGFAKASRRRQIKIAATSIGPGASGRWSKFDPRRRPRGSRKPPLVCPAGAQGRPARSRRDQALRLRLAAETR